MCGALSCFLCFFLCVIVQVFVGDPRSSEFVDHARYGKGQFAGNEGIDCDAARFDG